MRTLLPLVVAAILNCFPGICKIWHYKRKIARLRKKAGLLELYDPDDLPDPVYDKNYVQVLTEKEQIDLHYRESPRGMTDISRRLTMGYRAAPVHEISDMV